MVDSATNLWDALCISAGRRPQHPAIVRGDEQLNYGDWHRRSLDYAGWLLDQPGWSHDRVILWLDPSPEMAAALFGVWAASGIPVLLNPVSRLPQLQHAIAKTQPRFIFYSSATPLPDNLEIDIAVDVNDITASSVEQNLPGITENNSPASIVFTSGSTGLPKGVVQSHRNLARGTAVVSGYLGITTDDRILCPIPWAFDYGFLQLQMSAMTGATQYLPETQDPFSLCKAIETHRPTVFPGIPSLFAYLLQDISPFKQSDLSSIRIVTNTGGTIASPVLDQLLILFSHSRIFLNYGLTESYRTSYLDPELIHARRGSIGKAIPGVKIAIVRDDGSLAGPDEIGEIVHRGDFIFSGYWNDADATARSLRPDPVDTNSGIMALFTGDYGKIDTDGFLYYIGRRDHQLKVMGVRVSPGEIEALLHESGLIKEAAVFGVKHAILGDQVCAAIVPARHEDGIEKQLKQYARLNMTQNMMPRSWLVLDAIPKTSSGKPDFPALKSYITDDLQTFPPY